MLLPIKIIHEREVKDITTPNSAIFYVGRPTVLGNPFSMRNEAQRLIVISKYRPWLNEKVKSGDPEVLGLLRDIYTWYKEGKQVYLSCWCAPKPCHAEVIKDFVENHFYELGLASRADSDECAGVPVA